MDIKTKIVELAKSYLGEEEISGNRGWKNPEFQKAMQEMGWATREPWCMYLVELVYKKAYADTPFLAALNKLFSASALQTHRNFDASDWKTRPTPQSQYFIRTPQVGDIAIYRLGKSKTSGHGAIVVSVDAQNPLKYTTVDGNTSKANEREGLIVGEKTRFTNASFKPNGLNLVGFIRAKEIPDNTPENIIS